MSLSTLAKSIAESPPLKLNEEAQKLRERGEAVINMGVGEPKNKAPLNAILSSAAKLTTGDIKYSPTDGIPSLKKAILRYTEENYDKIVRPENVIVSSVMGDQTSIAPPSSSLPSSKITRIDTASGTRTTWASATSGSSPSLASIPVEYGVGVNCVP